MGYGSRVFPVCLLKGIVLLLNNREAMHEYNWLLVVFKGNCWITVISLLMILLADLPLCFFIFVITMEHHVMINVILLVFCAN